MPEPFLPQHLPDVLCGESYPVVALDEISRLTAKAVEARVELHARRPVVVELTSGHTKAIALDAVMLRRPFARDGGLDGFNYIQGKTPFGDTRIGGKCGIMTSTYRYV